MYPVTSIALITRLLALICAGWLFTSTAAYAQYTISQRVYKKLENVENLIDQKNYKSALSLLDELKETSANKKYELTLINLALGRIFYDTNRFSEAIETFNNCLALRAAPLPVIQNVRLNLLQSYVAANSYQKAIEQFSLWREKESSPSPDVLALGGSLYAYIKQYEKAIEYLKQAIVAGKQVNESWYRTLLSVYFEKQDYLAATDLLRVLISTYPDNTLYWTQLFSGYYYLNDFKNALAILELAYTKHILTSDSDIANLAKLYLYLGIPVKAVTLIKTEMKNNHLTNNSNNLQLLANAYVQSRQWDDAAKTYRQIAAIDHSENFNLLAAQLFFQTHQWQSVIDMLVLETTKNATDDGQFYILAGRAMMELHEPNKALQAFTKAKAQSATKAEAEKWIGYIEALAQLP